MFKWFVNLFKRQKGMNIQFRILKQMGPNDFLIHICIPIDQMKIDPNKDPWCHLGVIACTKEHIELMQHIGLNIIWTRDF
jgi:hypothetical protein